MFKDLNQPAVAIVITVAVFVGIAMFYSGTHSNSQRQLAQAGPAINIQLPKNHSERYWGFVSIGTGIAASVFRN